MRALFILGTIAAVAMAQQDNLGLQDPLNAFSTNIVGQCTDQCAQFQSMLGECASSDNYDSCVCAASFVQTATPCMNCDISVQQQNNGDPSDAQNALNTLNNQCPNVSGAASSSAAPDATDSASAASGAAGAAATTSAAAASATSAPAAAASSFSIDGVSMNTSPLTGSYIRGSSFFGSALPSTSSGSVSRGVVPLASTHLPATGPGGAVAGSAYPTQAVAKNVFSAAPNTSLVPLLFALMMTMAGAFFML